VAAGPVRPSFRRYGRAGARPAPEHQGPPPIEPRASTSDLPREVDALQERLEQGPCLDAVWEQDVVRVDEVRADDRLPEFARQASDLGIGSTMCFQLFVLDDRLEALNLHARTPGALDDEGVDIARELTDTGVVPGGRRL
jgi:hypothetical protein